MSHNHRNSHSNSNINRYATLADKIEVDKSSLHLISNDSNSISTEQELADRAEERELEVELRLLGGEEDRLLEEQLEILGNNIKRVSSALSTYIHSSSTDELEFEDKEMTSVLPMIVVKEEYQTSVVVVVY